MSRTPGAAVGRSLLLSHLDRRVLVVDGAMGTSIHACADCRHDDYLGRENCTDILVRSRPEMIQRIHESFLEVGADCVETDTFGANRLVLSEFDEEAAGWAFELNRAAAEIARAACDRHSTSDKPRFVLGSMGPGTKLVTLGQVTWEQMHASYLEQAKGLLAGGADAFIIETSQDLLQVKIAVNACLDAIAAAGRTPESMPILVSVTMETTGTMLLGSEIAAVVNALRPFPIASLGLNCATGPVEMAEHVAYLAKHWDRHVSVVPNAGLPALVDGATVYPLAPGPFGETMRRFLDEYAVDLVGGCCGTTPEHIRELVAAVDGRPRPQRRVAPQAPGCSSLYSFVEFRQENSFLIVAERTNANGSRKFKRLLDEESWDGLVSMAREEMRDGSHLLDLCVDFVGRDGVRDISETVSRFVRQVNAPLMLDSTDAAVIEAGLKRSGGRCIVNSINLEDGERRFDEICPLLRRHGAACVALTIDEDPQAGMAKTAERKLAIAERMHALYTEKWGLDERDLIFDPLTFTIATGTEEDRRLGLETLRGIEMIARRFPACGILLGLSNISFGLRPAARAVLNSVFLDEARARGLTAAIVHASKILPQNRIPAEQWEAALWLIHDRRGDERPVGTPESFDPLLHFISLFPEGEEAAAPVSAESLTLEERLQRHIVDGEQKGLEETLDEALGRYGPLEIINDHLLAGMKVVGELFGSGRMQLPFVLQSAAVMKRAVALLQPHMEKSGATGQAKAKVVLATVSGDVHDIGKNLVDIILSNNGYEVINLGIKQPLTAMVEAWRKEGADAIGMSGLLVKSVGIMEQNLHELNLMGVQVPVLLGGAALTRHYAEGHLRSIYGGPLYFGRDAFEGLAICDALAEGRLREIDDAIDVRLGKRAAVEAKVAESRAAQPVATVAEASSVRRDVVLPRAPFWGDRLVEELDLDDIYPFINPNALFRGQWGFKPGAAGDDEYKRLIDETVLPIFERMKATCRDEKILRPAVVYGYFPCNAEGDDLVVFDPEDARREIERFPFPRQASQGRLCISDFFRPIESGERDVVAFTCVTMGVEVSHRARQLFERNEYTEYLYMHGMGVETAEALAELWHKRIRAELGIGGDDSPRIRELFQQKYRGIRYSFGYPACPDMSHQEKLFRLLRPERIGCVLTENWQIDPEQSTSAIVVHHPEARYFSV
ncbi:MAG TPA: methionine synthase [Phycisphaerales bacterium]|nr:methionine synthase [Phycisphaerales bacterium]HMP36890.1 methionine synthase [Phycisphaerales bacterium]